MPDYKSIREMLKLVDKHYISGRDPMMSYLLLMAEEYCDDRVRDVGANARHQRNASQAGLAASA